MRGYRNLQKKQRELTRVFQFPFLVFLLLAFLLLEFTGCGEQLLSNPENIVEKTIRSQKKMESSHIEILLDINISEPEGDVITSVSSRSEGFFKAPESMQMKSTTGGKTTEEIKIGKKTYVKPSGSLRWTEKDESDSAGVFVPVDAASYLRYTENLRLVDRKDGRYHLEFFVDMEKYVGRVKVPGVDASLFKGTKAKMEVWIQEKTFFLEKTKMSFSGKIKELGMKILKVFINVEFSDFNEPVSIEAPI
ncbi:MAG: hypothetical protein PHP64_00245 [Actinomycetota bacterium]|nr:hypothetical protein [Actinomycetota bacterium]